MKLSKINKHNSAYLSALLSAILFALCIPFTKLLSQNVSMVLMGALLYLGAGLGLFITLIIKHAKPDLALTKKELPYAGAMIILDISAITLLIYGVSKTTASNVSLLGNFELVATSFFAYLIFKERVSKEFLTAIFLIISASIILTFERQGSLIFNTGSILVLLSCICWGLENNCTRKLSSKDTRQITLIKGLFSGIFGILTACLAGETFPAFKWILLTLILGFVSYGISVSLYIYAQRHIGAVKTGAIYSTAPFFGVLFSLILLNEKPLIQFYTALLIMFIALILIVRDTYNS